MNHPVPTQAALVNHAADGIASSSTCQGQKKTMRSGTVTVLAKDYLDFCAFNYLTFHEIQTRTSVLLEVINCKEPKYYIT